MGRKKLETRAKRNNFTLTKEAQKVIDQQTNKSRFVSDAIVSYVTTPAQRDNNTTQSLKNRREDKELKKPLTSKESMILFCALIEYRQLISDSNGYGICIPGKRFNKATLLKQIDKLKAKV